MGCPTQGITSRSLSLTLPGGLTIQVQHSSPNPLRKIEVALQMMGQASSAVAPLAPLFNMINLLLALVDFAKAVPQLITNPTEVTDAITKVVEYAAKVAQLAPPLSVPALVAGMIDIVIALLEGILEELQRQSAAIARIEATRAVLANTGNITLQASIDCAELLLEEQQGNLQEALDAAGGFMTMINTVSAIVGLGSLPAIGSLSDDPTTAIETINNILKTVKGVRKAIPL